VTPKTVEYDLRNTYRKLDIQTRQERRRVDPLGGGRSAVVLGRVVLLARAPSV